MASSAASPVERAMVVGLVFGSRRRNTVGSSPEELTHVYRYGHVRRYVRRARRVSVEAEVPSRMAVVRTEAADR